MRLCVTFLCAIGLFLSGCSPSYRGDTIPESIKDICKKEYSLDVDAKVIDNTLGAQLIIDGLIESIGGKTGISRKANEQLGNVITAIHRVIFSTDKQLDFYVVVVYDRQLPDATFTLVRNTEDVRRANSYDISTTEFFKRSLMDLSLKSPQGAQQEEGTDFIKDSISLPKFLALQMANRIKELFAKPAKAVEEPRAISVAGRFLQNHFVFLIDTDLPDEGNISIFSKAIEEILVVLKGYKFKDYVSIKLIHLSSKKSIDISMEDVQLVVQKKLPLESLFPPLQQVFRQ